MNHRKYSAVHTCPTVMNGSSTWQAPKYINMKKSATNTHPANRIPYTPIDEIANEYKLFVAPCYQLSKTSPFYWELDETSERGKCNGRKQL